MVDDLVANGLADFSLRRAARAAGTTDKVLWYHFEGVEDLLLQAATTRRSSRLTTTSSRPNWLFLDRCSKQQSALGSTHAP